MPSSLDEDATGVGERGQRLGLPSASVQRQHQLPAEPLPERVRPDQLGQLAGRLGRPAELEQQLDVLLGGGQPLLAEPGPDDLRPRAGNAVERVALPQPQAPTQATPPPRPGRPPDGTRAQRPAAGEQLRVELARCQPQQVAAAAGQQHLARRPVRPSRLERRPQPGDVDVQRVHRSGGQLVAPDPVDQLIARDRLVRPRRQQPEDRPPLRRAELELGFAAPGPHRPEHGHPHRRPVVSGHRQSARRQPGRHRQARRRKSRSPPSGRGAQAMTPDRIAASRDRPLNWHFQSTLREQQEAAGDS